MTKAEVEKLKEWKVAMAEVNRHDMLAYSQMTVLEKWRELQSLFHWARCINHPWDAKFRQENHDRLTGIHEELARTSKH